MADIEITDNGILIATLHGELDNHEANQDPCHTSLHPFSQDK